MNEELGLLVSDFFNVALPSDAIVRILSQLVSAAGIAAGERARGLIMGAL